MANVRLFFQTTSIVVVLMVCLQTPAAGALKGIGVIDAIDGVVRVKSLGSWGVASKTGLPLYPGDKLITGEDGEATVRFSDGATMAVSPNSLLRLIETVEAGSGEDAQPSRDRKVRLLFGKIRYTSGQSPQASPNVDAVIITPTAALSLDGTDVGVVFNGADTGYQTYQGKTHFNGSGSQREITGLTAPQAAEYAAYSASLEAIRVWSVYATMRNQLIRAKVRSDKLSFGDMSRADKVTLLREPEIRKYHIRLMTLLAKYAAASAREDRAECRALSNHPGGRISTLGQQGVRMAMEVIPKLEQAIDLSNLLKQEIEGMEETYASYGGDQNAIFALTQLMKATFEFNSAREKAALCRMLRVEAYTVGLQAIIFEADSLIETAQEPIESLQRFYRRSSKYGGLLLEDPNSERSGDRRLLLEMNVDAVTANAALVNLVVNAMETMFLYRSTVYAGNGAEEMQEALEELWRAVDARDRIAGIVDEAESTAEPGEEALSNAGAEVKELVKNTESSDDLFRVFMMEMIRRSMVLAPPVSEWLDRDWPIILIEPPITDFPEPPVNDLRPASPI